MRILLIEDHKMLASSLKDSMEREEDVEVDILENIDNLYKETSQKQYDIVLIDINLTGIAKNTNGLEISEDLIKKIPDLKIVILTGYNLKYYQDIAKDIGCYGFISKEEETKVLISNLRKILEQNKKIFPEEKIEIEKMTDTEIKILQLYSGGMTREEVASECFISVRSLAVNLNKIYKKLNVKNYQEMSKRAIELGYIDNF